MRICFIILFLIGLLVQSHAQTISDTLVFEETDSMHIDVQPEFPGGESKFMQFISSQLIYPADAKSKGIQGTSYIEFIVEKDGSLSTFKSVDGKSLSPSIDQAIIHVLLKSPRWQPGLKDGQPIRVRKIKKIKFILAD